MSRRRRIPEEYIVIHAATTPDRKINWATERRLEDGSFQFVLWRDVDEKQRTSMPPLACASYNELLGELDASVRPPGCSVCAHPVVIARGLCRRCYQRQHRGAPPSATHRRAPNGEASRLSIRMPQELRDRIEAAAHAYGASSVAFVRELLMYALDEDVKLPRKKPATPSPKRKSRARSK